MGWWSTAVMGGDTPLDAQGDIHDVIMTDKQHEAQYDRDLTPKELEMVRGKLSAFLDNSKKIENMAARYGCDDAEIFMQVVGVIAMEFGVAIPAKLKREIIQAAKRDDWSFEDKGRRKAMKSFIDDIKKFKGKKPTELKMADKGLMFAMFDHIAKKKSGLVNK
jgi:hypothetical protein